MIAPLVIILGICAEPKIINKTDSWNSSDKQMLEFSKVRCEQIYTDATCLKEFSKIEENVYWALCGK